MKKFLFEFLDQAKFVCTKHVMKEFSYRPLVISEPGGGNWFLIADRKLNKFLKILIWLILLFFLIISVLAINSCSMGGVISCTYQGKNGYNCTIKSRNIFGKANTKNYYGIERVDFVKTPGSNYRRDPLFEMHLIDFDGNRLHYTEGPRQYESVGRMVKDLNFRFTKNENFIYKMKGDNLIFFFCVAIMLFFLIAIFIFRDVVNNYVFKEVEPGIFKPVLRIKNVRKMRDAEILAFIKQKNDMEK